MRHLVDDYHKIVRSSFQETASRKTAENTVKYSDGGVGSMVVSQRNGRTRTRISPFTIEW